MPGQVFTGKVDAVFQAIATGQVLASGLAVAPTTVQAAPFVVRVRLDDDAAARTLRYRPAPPARRRSSPRTSGRPTSSAAFSCARSRS
jgi:hypothetical protein